MKQIFEKHKITQYSVTDAKALPLLENRKINPQSLSAAVFLIPYNTGAEIKDEFVFARYARSLDYHALASRLCAALTADMKARYGGEYECFCDNSPVEEKKAAELSGLGYIGKNNLLINNVYGSFVNICIILTTAAIPHFNAGSGGSCGSCNACVQACPVNALDGGFKREHCLSYISQKKSKTNDDYKILRANKVLWGCDMCQSCCPHNKNALKTPFEYYSKDFIDNTSLDTAEKMTDTEFARRAFSYRNRNIVTGNFLNLIDLNNKI